MVPRKRNFNMLWLTALKTIVIIISHVTLRPPNINKSHNFKVYIGTLMYATVNA